jgi:hypothetical protein
MPEILHEKLKSGGRGQDFTFEVDASDLVDFNPWLAYCLFTSPRALLGIFEEALSRCQGLMKSRLNLAASQQIPSYSSSIFMTSNVLASK